MRTSNGVRLQEGDVITPSAGCVDVSDATGEHGVTIYGNAEELETLAAHLKAAAALDRTRKHQPQLERVS